MTSCHHPLSAHTYARLNESEEIFAKSRLDDQQKQDCTYACKLATRVHAIMQVCLTGCRCTCKVAHMQARTGRLHIRMQESTCACKAASTHARLHVCTQELHDCTHTRKLDLCRHAQSAHQLWQVWDRWFAQCCSFLPISLNVML